MRTSRLYFAIGVVVPLVLAAPASGQDAKSFAWRGALRPGQTLEIRGINGSIHASPASGAQAEVTAVKRGRRSDPESVQIRVVPHQGGVTICSVYPTPAGKEPNACEPGGGRHNTRNNDVEVEFTAHVPAGVKLLAHNVNGGIEANGLTGDVDANTVNGGIKLVTAGLARASTVNGGIDVQMGRADWPGTMEMKTVNGGISVSLPANASTKVTASTVNGGLSTDFPLTVLGRFNPRRISGTIGEGGRELVLSTVNGGIELRRR